VEQFFREGIISTKPTEKSTEYVKTPLPYEKNVYPSMVHPVPDVGVHPALVEEEKQRIVDKLRAVFDGKGEHRATAEVKTEGRSGLDLDPQKKIIEAILKVMQKEEENLIEQQAMKKVRDDIADALKRQAERLDATAATPDVVEEINPDDLEALRQKILAERTEES
jgi:hypothetical protein